MVAFDKTGTLTKGSTEVTDFLFCANPSPTVTATFNDTADSLYDTFEPLPPTVAGHSGIHELRYLLHLMLLAECRSSHPLAKGITAFCKAQLALFETGGTPITTSPSSAPLPQEEDLLFDVVPGLGIHMHTANATAITSSSSGERNVDANLGIMASTSVLVGSGKLLATMNVSISPAAERTASSYRAGGQVAIFMAVNGRLRAIVGKL